MTARVTSLTGVDAGAYYVDPDRYGLATYYLDAGEPPGVWLGKQAAAFGLIGDVDREAFLSLVNGLSPTGDKLGRAYNDESVRGYDITFSAPKSVSTLWALGDEHVAGESLAAHDAAVRAVLDFVERHATTPPRSTARSRTSTSAASRSQSSGSTRAACSIRSCTPTLSWSPKSVSRTVGGSRSMRG